MALCKDCLHFEVCNWLGKTVVFEVDDGVCLFFEPERPKGRWEWRGGIPWCTNCGEMPPDYSYGGDANTTQFCPNCGADMRGESDGT